MSAWMVSALLLRKLTELISASGTTFHTLGIALRTSLARLASDVRFGWKADIPPR